MDKFKKEPSYQAFRLLQLTFFIIPFIAGVDKFFDLLVDWSSYISPVFLRIIENRYNLFMMIVGGIEIIAAIGVIFRPKFFAYIIAIWICAIIVNLLATGQYFDIALRDLGLMLSAMALGKLSPRYVK